MNRVILTIDDIPSKNTPAIVDYLNDRGIKAILFAIGKNIERYYDEAVYAVKNGMIVGNHSYSHPSFSSLTLEECIDEIEKCETILDELYRSSAVERTFRPFRFPFGDKGGKNKAALQQYFKEKRFDKADDSYISYPWWRENKLNKDIDTFWTYDFEEYRLHHDQSFTEESIWAKMHINNPKSGAALFGENNWHILLMHAHDDTEAILPEYYKLFLDHLIDNDLTFEKPEFIRI